MSSGLKTHNVKTKKLSLWVAEEITSAKKIKSSNPRFRFFPEINSMNLNAPAIQTGVHTDYCVGLKEMGATELGRGDDDKNIIELNPEYKIGEEYKLD